MGQITRAADYPEEAARLFATLMGCVDGQKSFTALEAATQCMMATLIAHCQANGMGVDAAIEMLDCFMDRAPDMIRKNFAGVAPPDAVPVRTS